MKLISHPKNIIQLLQLFAEHKRLTREEIVYRTGFSRPTFFRSIKHLKQFGVILLSRRMRDTSTVYYRVTNWGVFSPKKIREHKLK